MGCCGVDLGRMWIRWSSWGSFLMCRKKTIDPGGRVGTGSRGAQLRVVRLDAVWVLVRGYAYVPVVGCIRWGPGGIFRRSCRVGSGCSLNYRVRTTPVLHARPTNGELIHSGYSLDIHAARYVNPFRPCNIQTSH